MTVEYHCYSHIGLMLSNDTSTYSGIDYKQFELVLKELVLYQVCNSVKLLILMIVVLVYPQN